MSRVNQDLKFWKAEHKHFLQCYDSPDVPANMNRDAGTFRRYANMQSNLAYIDGFWEICCAIRYGFNQWITSNNIEAEPFTEAELWFKSEEQLISISNNLRG